MSARHVALLRGVNVGGKNKLPMKELVAIFADAGGRDVATYIQSGNVVFTAAAREVKALAARVEAAIEARFGFQSPVVVRSARELDGVAAENPFLGAGPAAESLHVMFLAERPSAAQVAALDPERSPPDRFQVVGREIFLVLPNGAARTKLTNAYFDSKLKTVSTGRNWRTVLTLQALVNG